MNNDNANTKPETTQTTSVEGLDGAACSPCVSEVDEILRQYKHHKSSRMIVGVLETLARRLENERDSAICEATNAVNDVIGVAWEKNRYKTALEGIAGYPHQYFDAETPWRMRKLAEHALSLENSFINRPVAFGDEKRPNQNQETI